jgi:uncharacterized protein YyaL (SSP411 family)
MGQTTHPYANRLIDETSPYLLQHAHNPVNWYPWGPEAFDLARQQDKPVFLSIGYSTCHWCHVMERESFEDGETARLLNQDFVSIKVDREQRPDIDDIYMKAVHLMTASGGWPLSVFLTPEGKPFYGGTYFPARAGFGRPSFRQVLEAVARAWRERRTGLGESAEALTEALREAIKPSSDQSVQNRRGKLPACQTLSPDILTAAFAALSESVDPVHGGFGEAPKFPQPTMLTFLLHYWHRTGEGAALEIVEKTLDHMARGGIHDHLGGGFHRYSVDARWLIPHFEKMLYDQALLSRAYVQAYQITRKPGYAGVARDIFNYVLRDLTDAQGGFYAAEDADSDGREGAFYVWTREEIAGVLGEPRARIFCGYYGVTHHGNFGEGENVLHAAVLSDELVAQLDMSPQEIEQTLADARHQLLARRRTRSRPATDDKIIASWNGLMISALAYGGAVLGNSAYVEAARAAAAFVLDSLQVDGRLMRYARAGRTAEKAFLDDYAFLILGLIELYEACFEVRWLREARSLAERMIELFADPTEEGFFLAGKDAERLITRDKPGYDGAIPGGNSTAALALLRLGALLMEERFTQEAERVLRRFADQMVQVPAGLTAMLLALDYWLGPAQEIVVVAPAPQAQTLIEECRRHFLPKATLLVRRSDAEAEALAAAVPFTRNLAPANGHAVYVCENHICRQPVTTPEKLREILRAISGQGVRS